MAIPFFLGGGVSEEVETLGEALPLLNSRQSVTPPPQVSGSTPDYYSTPILQN